MKRTTDNKGLSLVEIIIVIAIMSILAGLIMPNFLQYLDKARKTRDLEMARVLGTSLERAIAIDPTACKYWDIIGANHNGLNRSGEVVHNESHLEYKVTDHTTGRQYKISNIYEFTLTKKGDVVAVEDHPEWHCEKNYRNGVLRYARRGTTSAGENLLWDAFVDELGTIDIKIMYQKYSIRQYKISKNLENGRVEVWVCPVPPGTDGEGSVNGWVYYRLYPDPDPRYMSNEPPVATNAGGAASRTF
ncbi:MAG: prepilin-type N-terminal cleavage/methylation domain-containing protein [Lachnospiraceae bacterium]|nr:prepilin-type N-terminal cleavage/methylation domain-containing protein [Lachnospiraceae bacterium]